MTDRYAAAGVHLDTADEAKRRIAELVRQTRTELALGALGAFGGMVRLPPGFTDRRPLGRDDTSQVAFIGVLMDQPLGQPNG